MNTPAITPKNVLSAVQGGLDTIWALGAVFGVPAVSRDLKDALDALMADGLVAASDPDIYIARLKTTATD